jgi:DNA-binding transcriptional MerR regulator
MDGYSISEVAERTGFPATTLRYYEQTGLVRPDRTPAGYRSYDDDHVELLSFIGRAKGFGLSLDEIAELLALLDGDECAPVKGRLRDLVHAKIGDARAKIAELDAFADELQRVAVTLNGPTPDGPCDGVCGCTSDHVTHDAAPIELVPKAAPGEVPPIACTLAPDELGGRLDDWRTTVARASTAEPVASGVRLRFDRDADIAALAALMAAEQDCCRFLRFELTVDADDVTLEVSGPPDAQPVIDSLLGLRS